MNRYKPARKAKRPRFRVGQRVMIIRCEGEVVEKIRFERSHDYMLHVAVAGNIIPCYRDELRPLTSKEAGR